MYTAEMEKTIPGNSWDRGKVEQMEREKVLINQQPLKNSASIGTSQEVRYPIDPCHFR